MARYKNQKATSQQRSPDKQDNDMDQNILALKYAENVGNVLKAVAISMDDIAALNTEQLAKTTKVELG